MTTSDENELDAYDVQMIVAYTILHDVVGVRDHRDANGERYLAIEPHRQAGLLQFFDDFHDVDCPKAVTARKRQLNAALNDYLFQQSIRKDEAESGYNRALLTLAAVLADDIVIGRKPGRPPYPSFVKQERIAGFFEAAMKLQVLLSSRNRTRATWTAVVHEANERLEAQGKLAKTENLELNASNLKVGKNRISEAKRDYIEFLLDFGHAPKRIFQKNGGFKNDRSIEPFMIPWEPSETEMDEVPEWETKIKTLLDEEVQRRQHSRSGKP